MDDSNPTSNPKRKRDIESNPTCKKPRIVEIEDLSDSDDDLGDPIVNWYGREPELSDEEMERDRRVFGQFMNDQRNNYRKRIIILNKN